MLVLSRKVDEKIQIGDGITVTVLKIVGNHVSLGIQAPHDVPIARQELLEAPQADLSRRPVLRRQPS